MRPVADTPHGDDDRIIRELTALRDAVEANGQGMLAYLIDLAILEAERHGTRGPRAHGTVVVLRPREVPDS